MRYPIVLWLMVLTPMWWGEETFAADNCINKYAAKVVSLQGQLLIEGNGKEHGHPGQLNEAICEGGSIHVQANSRASIMLPNVGVVRVMENTDIKFNRVDPEKTTFIEMAKGFIHFISRTPQKLEINTPIANAGPEGTEFAISVDENKASLWVYEGGVKFFNAKGSVHLSPGQGAQALLGQAPQARIDIKPQDAVSWALYYPPVLPYPAPSDIVDSTIRTAIQEYRQGHVDIALSQLDALSPDRQTAYFHKVRGAMRLTAGQDRLAMQDIQVLLASNPNDAEALALQSVRALTQNRKDEAYALANKAVTANPKSASAYSALSYAEQGRFNLAKAQAAADQAANLAPHDAFVWARKAELELSQGLTTDSRKAAQKAAALDANLERTQTIMGFSHLLRMDTDEALQSFNKAVELDSTSPLARLGLGLAKIRNGDLKEGRQDLEIAAILDPNNSIVRSYLGKAYYEERRSPLADTQLGLAKERDPKDPTPYFYDAINKQTTNRPVEALHDMQKAIELNDNRGVYRSSLAIDKDLAARSAAQGRIYNELGFQQQGLLEGWKSVNQDSSNYSAHRLLADNYAALPRHEIARASELLQSQLLQPVNITPIQPNLAETNLFILNGLGPNGLSFNEYNPLFEYNRFAFQTSGLYGSNNTLGDNTTLSGIHDNVSFSLGQFHYETDGFRENNFLKKDLYNAFIQAQITDDLNLQAEYRHEDRDNGDISLNFALDNFLKDFKQKSHVDSYRIGGRYELSLNSSLIGSFLYQEVNSYQKNVSTDFIPFTDIPVTSTNESNSRRNGFISELQHIYNQSNFNLINGFGYLDQESNKINFTDGTPLKDLPTLFTRTNLYNYTKIYLTNKFSATLGLSVDFYKRGSLKETPINPKLGIEWSPFSTTTLRAAVYRVMSVTLLSSQTIEPTQVAGFNQLFDDIDGTVSWRFGTGIDHKFSKNIATGLEYSERKLQIPGGQKRSEQLGRAYLNFTPQDMISLGLEYFYERIDQLGRTISSDSALSGGLFDVVETHRLPVTLSFFHPSGLSFKIKNSLIHQSGIFQNLESSSTFAGKSDFFVVDLNLSYRFPQRYGVISFGVNNLLNEKFQFQNTNINEPILAPGRIVFSRITLAF